MTSRSKDRVLMRKIAEQGIVRIIGTIPRRARRAAARVYANAAYRQLNWLPELIRTAGKKKGHPHPAVLKWVVREFVKHERPAPTNDAPAEQVAVSEVPEVGPRGDGEGMQGVS